MKVKIMGDDLTSENFASVIDDLNKKYGEYGLKVKNATCYIRFMDETGATVEPTCDGDTIESSYSFKKTRKMEIPKEGEKNDA